VLLAAGYLHVGLDHFALPTDELVRARQSGRLRRNFQGYTVCDTEQLVAFGVSAISDVGGTYVQNAKRLSEYYAAVESDTSPATLAYARSADDDLRRDMIMTVMCRMELDFADVGRRHGIDVESAFAAELCRLDALAKDGLVLRRPGGFTVTELGRAFLRRIASAFDAYLPRAQEQSVTMSRAV
jgi:oxygen-independent coproporphyrinogen-3 oxidase